VALARRPRTSGDQLVIDRSPPGLVGPSGLSIRYRSVV